MRFRNLFELVKWVARPARHQPASRQAPSCRLAVEALDERIVPSTLSLSVGNSTIVEGNADTRYAEVSVNLNAPAQKTVTVKYNTGGGTALAGSDYLSTIGTLTFARREIGKTIRVPVIGDRSGEADETFLVNLSGAKGATIAVPQGVVTILDDEPRISVGYAEVTEGNSGNTALTLTVSLSSAYDQAVTVAYATADGTGSDWYGAALAGEDYVATAGTLTFAPGETTKTITVEVLGDTTVEPHEQFYMVLSAASSNSLILQDTYFGGILDDDGYDYGNWGGGSGGYWYFG
jgi:hypothetical protein